MEKGSNPPSLCSSGEVTPGRLHSVLAMAILARNGESAEEKATNVLQKLEGETMERKEPNRLDCLNNHPELHNNLAFLRAVWGPVSMSRCWNCTHAFGVWSTVLFKCMFLVAFSTRLYFLV